MRVRAALALMVSFLIIPAGAAVAAPLHTPHKGTTVECDGEVRWHFVHNQVGARNATAGTLTATFSGDGVVMVDAYKVLRTVRHYEVITSGGDTLMDASDNIAEGKLVLSDYDCLGTPPPPTDECVAGDTVTVMWGDVLLRHTLQSATMSTSLLPGTYSVTLTSTDPNHAPGYQPEQDAESWYVVLKLEGSQVTVTGTITDLPTDDTTMTQMVGTITLTEGADEAVATHALFGLDYTPHWGSQESVEPTSAVFTCL